MSPVLLSIHSLTVLYDESELNLRPVTYSKIKIQGVHWGSSCAEHSVSLRGVGLLLEPRTYMAALHLPSLNYTGGVVGIGSSQVKMVGSTWDKYCY